MGLLDSCRQLPIKSTLFSGPPQHSSPPPPPRPVYVQKLFFFFPDTMTVRVDSRPFNFSVLLFLVRRLPAPKLVRTCAGVIRTAGRGKNRCFLRALSVVCPAFLEFSICDTRHPIFPRASFFPATLSCDTPPFRPSSPPRTPPSISPFPRPSRFTKVGILLPPTTSGATRRINETGILRFALIPLPHVPWQMRRGHYATPLALPLFSHFTCQDESFLR